MKNATNRASEWRAVEAAAQSEDLRDLAKKSAEYYEAKARGEKPRW